MLCCSACGRGERSNPNHAGSCDDLDCTEVSFRKNISSLAALFYVSVYTILAVGSRHPGTDEFGTVLFCFSISLSEAGLNEVRVELLEGRQPRPGSIHDVSEPAGFNSRF